MEQLIIFTRIFQVTSIMLSLSIAYITYRAYEQNESQKMKLLSLGFLTIGLGTMVEGILFEIAEVDILQAHLVESVVILAAFSLIYYAMIIKKERIDL